MHKRRRFHRYTLQQYAAPIDHIPFGVRSPLLPPTGKPLAMLEKYKPQSFFWDDASEKGRFAFL